MKADFLTRLCQWGEKPNEGDPIIDAMAGDLQEALELIEAERARVIGIIEVHIRASEADGTDGELWVLRHVLDAVNASPPADASRLMPTPADDGGGSHETAVVLRRHVDELAEKLAYEEDRRTEAENDRDRFVEGSILLEKRLVERGDERDAYRIALEQITKLKPEPIAETGFATGPKALLDQAQRIARDAIRGAKR